MLEIFPIELMDGRIINNRREKIGRLNQGALIVQTIDQCIIWFSQANLHIGMLTGGK